MRCQAYARCVSNVSVRATFPVRMLWLLKMSLGTGQTWGEKRSVLIFEGATPTFCFSIFEQSFFRSGSSMLIWMWIIELFQQFSFLKLSRFLPNFRGIRPLPSLCLSLSLSLLQKVVYAYICVDMYRYPLMHTCINIYIYTQIYTNILHTSFFFSLSLWFGMKVAGVLVLASVTIKGANFWGLERRKNVVPIRSTFKVPNDEYWPVANGLPRWPLLETSPQVSKRFTDLACSPVSMLRTIQGDAMKQDPGSASGKEREYLGGTLIGRQKCLVFWVPKLDPVWIHPFVSTVQ